LATERTSTQLKIKNKLAKKNNKRKRLIAGTCPSHISMKTWDVKPMMNDDVIAESQFS
jgi:hypothetical protein